MAVKLRLVRMGKKKQPTYRVVAADSRSPRDGRFIEIIGTYEPRQEPSVVKIKNDRAVHWLRHGAQPTERVHKLLKISGALDVFKSCNGKNSNGLGDLGSPNLSVSNVASVSDVADSSDATDTALISDATDATDSSDATESADGHRLV